ncbi:MAG: phosphoribosylformylglycinamidine cyclo-ligase [Clostridia bacterium]|nr:phosphoribosylformylglycinamidine cyclo-ligase [Clostridia bacterium]
MSEAYLSRGVSAEKTDVHNAVKKLDKGVFKGAFCTMMPDPTGDSEYCAAMHADGAGTKSSLAYIKFNETGDYTAFTDIAQDSMVMNLDDLLCVGATGGFIMSNTIGRNAHRVDGNAIKAVIGGYTDFVEKMRKYGVDITMCGGETADVGDLVSTLIVDSTFFVRMKRSDVIDCDNIQAGDVIVGFASFGQAVYEDKYNAGMGSNGLTAARHLLLAHEYASKYPETYSNTIPEAQVYCGKYKFTDKLPGTDVCVGDAILSPTRTYAPIVKDILDADRGAVHGMVHCTGGGQVKCKNFGKGLHYIKDNLFDTPPLFKAIAENADVGAAEMYRIFNMGHRLEIYTTPDKAEAMIKAAEKYGVEAKIVGRVEKSDSDMNKVTIKHNGKEFNY